MNGSAEDNTADGQNWATAPKVEAFGDRAVLVEWAIEGYSQAASERALALAARLASSPGGRFTEIVPGYASVMAEFDPARETLDTALESVRTMVKMTPDTPPAEGRRVEVPVRFGGSAGPDLGRICAASGLSEDEVITRYSGRDYRVCMMGFMPGFAFLSDVDPLIAHPRHASPRARVPAGSVGIAGWQTGIYGLDSPGGWQIVGRTKLRTFDPARDPMFALRAGDRVRFVPC